MLLFSCMQSMWNLIINIKVIITYKFSVVEERRTKIPFNTDRDLRANVILLSVKGVN